ncbi:conjugal transfer protein TraG [Bacillus sp. UMB0899]|nr:conjugal transfer protein TraG [Bacillus sp. UMB0899]
MKDNSTLMRKLPFWTVTFFITLTLVLSIRSITNITLLLVGQFTEEIPVFLLFGSPLKPSILGLIMITIIGIGTWLISTKFKIYQGIVWRVVIFFACISGITAYYTWLLTAPVYNNVVPYILKHVAELEVTNIWHGVLVGNPKNLMVLLVFIPLIVVVLLLIWLFGQYSQHSNTLKEIFFEFEFKQRHLQLFFMMSAEEHWPDVILGPDSATKELLIQPGRDRTLNNVIIGSIGSGKTAALALPTLNQDLHWMTKFINEFSKVYERQDYHTEEVKGMYLNGISVIEPSNDLCKKTFDLVRAHNIPEETVFYIDPTNPDTPSINPMKGPVEQVAEAFAMVIEGLAEGGDGGNFFFQQSERNHLKHYIYLLKLHDPNKEVTFDMLLDMYDDPQLVRRMHVTLKKTFPENIEAITNRDERNHWNIVKQIDKWFDTNLLPKTSGGKNAQAEVVKEGEFRGDTVFYDAKAEYVQGLRNILNDIGANKLIRRVLFGKSDFDFDKHLEFGGVLLCNTAKGELANLSNVLGKLVLLSLQNAVFRREPNISSYHHILVDEFPDYIYLPFKEFPAQSRKYKVIVTVVAQTIAQLADKYGDKYMHTLLGTLRHKMVYGDIPEFDAELFSGIFGEKDVFEESMSEQSVSPLQESPVTRAGSNYTKKREVIMSPNDIIYQKPFQAAVKLVVNNRPIPVRQVNANFVPKREFKKARFTVIEDNGFLWLEERNKSLIDQGDPSLDLVSAPLDEEEVYDNQSQGEKREKFSYEEVETQWNYHQEQPVNVKYKKTQPSTDRLRNSRRTIPTQVIEIDHTEIPSIIDQRVVNNTEAGSESLTNPDEETAITTIRKHQNIEIPITTLKIEEKRVIPIAVESQSDDNFLDETFGKEENSEVAATSELSLDQEHMFEELKKHISDIPTKTQNTIPSTKDELDLDEFMNDYKE